MSKKIHVLKKQAITKALEANESKPAIAKKYHVSKGYVWGLWGAIKKAEKKVGKPTPAAESFWVITNTEANGSIADEAKSEKEAISLANKYLNNGVQVLGITRALPTKIKQEIELG